MRLLIFLLLSTPLFASCGVDAAEAKENAQTYASYEQSEDPIDSLLHGIQDKIERSFVQSLARSRATPLEKLSEDLAKAQIEKPQRLLSYWQSYLDFYHAIYHMESDESELAEQRCMEAIQRLDNMKNKNSEDYALLGMLTSFSISFKPGIKAPFIGARGEKYVSIALELDPQNPRAHYVKGNGSYYKPKQFGGGKHVESSLKRALSLPAQRQPNPYLPSWGHEEAYETLIKWYIREEQYKQAQKWFDKAVQDYPDSYTINRLASQLANK